MVIRSAAGADRLDQAGRRIGNLAEGFLAQEVRNKVVDRRTVEGVLGPQQLSEGRGAVTQRLGGPTAEDVQPAGQFRRQRPAITAPDRSTRPARYLDHDQLRPSTSSR